MISQKMTADHRRCDELFAAAEASVAAGGWVDGAEQLNRFARAMDRHLRIEEEVLFPAFEEDAGGVAGPTAVMCSEHRQMRRLMEEMAQAVEARSRDEYLGLSETLMLLMQQHNMKEERILYPMLDRALSQHTGEVPEALQRLEE